MTTVVLAAAVLLPVYAQREETRRASMRGGGDHGKCTIEVNVDDIAEVYISGDTARLRTLSGSRAEFRRFECNGPMPPNPVDFRFSGVDGRGRQTLQRDPRQNGGVAVVRIEDKDGGREGYTFDIEWRGDGGGFPGGGGIPGRPGLRPGDDLTPETIAACQDAVRDRANRELGFREINFLQTGVDNGRGRRDFVSGTFEARRAGRDQYSYTCSVDLSTGRIRNVDLQRAGGGPGPGPGAGDVVRACEQAVVERLQGDGYSAVTFRGSNMDSRRADYVVGGATARDRYGSSNFDFSCAIGPRGGIRSVEVNRR